MLHSDTCVCGFVAEYRWLSNFYPCAVTVRGVTFHSAEAAYQSEKFPEDRLLFAGMSAAQAKQEGQKIWLNRDKSRAWDQKKIDVMREVVWLKFTQNPLLEARLIATGARYLEETNCWKDRFWGVYKEEGLNHLGRILTSVRTCLQAGNTMYPRWDTDLTTLST